MNRWIIFLCFYLWRVPQEQHDQLVRNLQQLPSLLNLAQRPLLVQRLQKKLEPGLMIQELFWPLDLWSKIKSVPTGPDLISGVLYFPFSDGSCGGSGRPWPASAPLSATGAWCWFPEATSFPRRIVGLSHALPWHPLQPGPQSCLVWGALCLILGKGPGAHQEMLGAGIRLNASILGPMLLKTHIALYPRTCSSARASVTEGRATSSLNSHLSTDCSSHLLAALMFTMCCRFRILWAKWEWWVSYALLPFSSRAWRSPNSLRTYSWWW